jgi:hypothetical protein
MWEICWCVAIWWANVSCITESLNYSDVDRNLSNTLSSLSPWCQRSVNFHI